MTFSGVEKAMASYQEEMDGLRAKIKMQSDELQKVLKEKVALKDAMKKVHVKIEELQTKKQETDWVFRLMRTELNLPDTATPNEIQTKNANVRMEMTRAINDLKEKQEKTDAVLFSIRNKLEMHPWLPLENVLLTVESCMIVRGIPGDGGGTAGETPYNLRHTEEEK